MNKQALQSRVISIIARSQCGRDTDGNMLNDVNQFFEYIDMTFKHYKFMKRISETVGLYKIIDANIVVYFLVDDQYSKVRVCDMDGNLLYNY